MCAKASWIKREPNGQYCTTQIVALLGEGFGAFAVDVGKVISEFAWYAKEHMDSGRTVRMRDELLREIPKMDELLAQGALCEAEKVYGRAPVLASARETLMVLREGILAGEVNTVPDIRLLAEETGERAAQSAMPSLRRVINATGVILHTNLGRAPLAEQAAAAAESVSRGYSTLEYDLETGARGSRHSHASSLLTELTGAEDAMVVHNNAAAVLLMLSALLPASEVVVSRGELVEIGGAFRVPEIMALSGAKLREVGTTNRTHPRDYEVAITDATGALLKVHRSNFAIVGFTRETSLVELVSIGRARGVPVLYDLGGGLLRAVPGVSIPGEPTVLEAVRTGADMICFSGDKLFGGPQAGILLGVKDAIARCKAHPLARALRADKMTLAALSATLSLYRDESLALREIPILRMIACPMDALSQRAQRLLSGLSFLGGRARVVDAKGAIGGGTSPGFELPSKAVEITGESVRPEALCALMRGYRTPIVARIERDALLLDMRTVDDSEVDTIAACVRQITDEKEGGI